MKEDLAVSKKKSVLLNPALKRAHTARHSPQATKQPSLINKTGKGEASRNMVSVPEGALGKIRT